MAYPLGEDVPHMGCREGNQVIQAFPPQRADEPLAERIGLGALRWSFEDAQAQVTDMLVKLQGENAVAVVRSA